MPNYFCYKHHLHSFTAYYLTKALCDIVASYPKDFVSEGRKSAKNA